MIWKVAVAYSLVVEIIHFALEEGMSTFLDRHDLEKGDVPFFVLYSIIKETLTHRFGG